MYHILALIVLMEAENQSVPAQIEVARTALSIAKHHKVSLKKSLKLPGIYSWQWDGRSTKTGKVNKENLAKIVKVLKRNKLTPSGRIYMNPCRLGRKFKTNKKMIKRDKLCFY